MGMKKALAATIGAAAVWGASFPAMKYLLGSYGPLTIIASRFSIAAIIAFSYLAIKKEKISREEALAGIATGIVLFASFATQAYGQQDISAAQSAFITGLYVIFVPIMSAVSGRKFPMAKTWIAVAMGLGGLWLLTGGMGGIGIGEGLTVACAVGFAAHIMLLSKYSRLDSLKFVAMQIATVAFLSSAGMMALEGGELTFTPLAIILMALLGIFATLLAYFAQAYAQKSIQPETIALLFLSEPAFAYMFSWALLGEGLGLAKLAGCGLILAGMAVSQSGQALQRD
ncbi:MAG: DMT family transporter [Candidatus Micrarchaeia archaeon]